MEIVCFSAIIHQYNIVAISVVHVCFKFLFISYHISFLPARVTANLMKSVFASSWYVRMENNNCTSNTNNYV